MTDALKNEPSDYPDLEAVADALPNALVIINRQGIVVLANTTVPRILNIPADQNLVGIAMWQALPEGLRETVAAMQREVLIYGTEARREFDQILPDGQRRLLDVQLTAVAGKNNQTEFFSLSLSEAGARQEVEELKKLDNLKSNFLALISHELRTPLTSIRGAVHLLSNNDKVADNPEKTLIEIIAGNSERLIRLVNNLLEMVAIDNETFVVNRAPTPIGPLVSKAIAKFQQAASAKFIGLEHMGDDAIADVDPERIIQFFSYLLDNAIKFTSTGGRIVIHTRALAGGGVEVVVADSGCGVPAHAREQIFDRFYQVEDPMTRCSGGAGVGLYLAKHIVQCHGGKVWVDVGSSDGSEFHATFPSARIDSRTTIL